MRALPIPRLPDAEIRIASATDRANTPLADGGFVVGITSLRRTQCHFCIFFRIPE